MLLSAVAAAIWWPITLHDTSGRYYATQVSCGSLWVDDWPLPEAEVTAAMDIFAGAAHTHLDRPNCLFARRDMTAALRWPEQEAAMRALSRRVVTHCELRA